MRTLDFLVIGAGMSGTTSLWRGLDSHPQVLVPSDKERGFFNSDDRYEKGLDRFVKWTFPEAGDDQVLGTVTPQLMPGDSASLDVYVDRIAATCPEIRLISLLRNPVDRAVSHYRRGMRVAGGHSEDFDTFTRRVAKKHGGMDKVPFLCVSEYGRILSRYLSAIDRDRILILFTEDLESRPDWLYRQVFEFLGVDPDHEAEQIRMNVGGTSQRLSADALQELLAELERTVWPHLSDPDAKRGFVWWLRHIWNCEPDQQGMEVSPKLRAALSRRYLRDARILREEFGIKPPWIPALQADRKRAVAEEAAPPAETA